MSPPQENGNIKDIGGRSSRWWILPLEQLIIKNTGARMSTWESEVNMEHYELKPCLCYSTLNTKPCTALLKTRMYWEDSGMALPLWRGHTETTENLLLHCQTTEIFTVASSHHYCLLVHYCTITQGAQDNSSTPCWFQIPTLSQHAMLPGSVQQCSKVVRWWPQLYAAEFHYHLVCHIRVLSNLVKSSMYFWCFLSPI